MENLDSSTMVRAPEEIKKWNWSAFFLTFIWGLPNKIYFSLLVFVPLVGLIVPFILGVKGNQWAWEKNHWDSIESFKKAQKKWAKITLIILLAVIMISLIMVMIMSISFGKMEITSDSLEILDSNERAVSLLGENIKKGFLFTGSISLSGDNGDANISFPVKGSKGKGKLYLKANKDMGLWEIQRLVLEIQGVEEGIDLLKGN